MPTVPGSDGLVRTPDEAFRVAKEVIPATLTWSNLANLHDSMHDQVHYMTDPIVSIVHHEALN